MKKAINLVFPNQLFAESALLENGNEIYLIEEFIFFKQYKFHKQKIAFHRASMKAYEQYLKDKNLVVHYIASSEDNSAISILLKSFQEQGISEVQVVDPVNNYLEVSIHAHRKDFGIHFIDNPSFINTKIDLEQFFKPDKKSFFQTSFYKQQRKKLNILLDENEEPVGGKWTFDDENRKKYPKEKTPPNIYFPKTSKYWIEAVEYTEEFFSANPGEISNDPIYPINHEQAAEWLDQFLNQRFFDFGAYEDAIVKQESFLNHSLLSPLLNSGLILPMEILNKGLAFAEANQVPINSTEGFVRQIIGWREFMRGMYECKGAFSRTKNFWNFTRKIPPSFYDGTTGIEPIDCTIKQILKTGYCHHIERLMVLGNFMLLCEFHPDEVYRWFMELFIDAYDWVMVPNIYGMSQFSDGGTFATKPYIGGSNYIHKMSNYPKGNWEEIWDGLFWRFMHEQQDFFSSNPRLGMLLANYRRMSDEKRTAHLNNANGFLERLDKSLA
jgi:deoxyribodipyrimidine photolyase-related protein